MSEWNIAITIISVASVLLVWGLVALARSPRDADHDLRRRALTLLGTVAGLPAVGVQFGPTYLVSAVVLLVGIWLVLPRR